jgi:hypothetical protein
LGGINFVDAATLRAGVKLQDSAGRAYAPVPEGQLGGDVKNLVAILRTMFGNMLGAMGEGMQVFFFPAETAAGEKIAVASKEGSFSLKLGEQTFSWRLPLSSLLPQKTCPEDGEKMNGAWKFCPWHGKTLVAVKP